MLRLFVFLNCAGTLALAAGCTRTAVIVDNSPKDTQTVVTVEHHPKTQPSDKDMIIHNHQ